MTDKRVNVAIIGLGFGAEFIPIYQKHPHANMYAICQRTESNGAIRKAGNASSRAERLVGYRGERRRPAATYSARRFARGKRVQRVDAPRG